VLKGLKRHAIAALLLYLALLAAIPVATAEIEIRQGLRSDGLLYHNEIIILPLVRTLFHKETLAATDTEAFALTPLSPAPGNGVALAQTSAETAVGTQTGFFDVNLPFMWLDDWPGQPIGDGLNWVANAEPITFAGIPQNTMMTFPSMIEIIRVPNGTGLGTDSSIIAFNNTIPYFPGNILDVRTAPDEQGINRTTFERFPRDYMTLFASPEEVANRTIMERMWRNVHINFNLDRAYHGETCYPALIYPIEEPYTLMPMVPDETSIRDSLKRTQPGTRLKRIFWTVAS
jgi:hypothetical protein